MVAVNVLQNRPIGPPREWKRKHDVVNTWRALSPPATFDGVYDGELIFRGCAAPASFLVTHVLFAFPRVGWVGKTSHCNRFRGGEARPFKATFANSKFDGKPALILEYTDPVWGTIAGMRDELRELEPGVLLGLGSMRITGGVANCAPFILTLVR